VAAGEWRAERGAVSWLVRLRLGLVVVATVVLQTTLFPDLRFFGAAPDLGLVAAIAVAYRKGPETGAVYGFVNGLAIDLFLQTPLGLSALTFAVVAYGVGIVQTGLSRASRWVGPLFGGVGGLAGGLMFVGLAAVVGEDQVIALRSLHVVALAAAYDALLASPVFAVARWATASEQPAVRTGRPA
jgi:rod shape-determining protein MreD